MIDPSPEVKRTWQYEYAGLGVVSELELPEWAEFERAAGLASHDVSILLQPASAAPPPARLTRTEWVFFRPSAGAFQVREGREISITPLPESGARELRLFLLGSAWGALCYQRGILLLHASFVAVDGQATGFCGPSGSGKSSLAAALVAHGASLLGDDLCNVTFAGDGPALIYPSAPRLKLWQDGVEQNFFPAQDLERDHFRLDKFHIPAHRSAPAAPIPIKALYLLAWGPLEVTHLRGALALQALVQHATYRKDLLEPMGVIADHWARLAELARCIPIRRLTRPKDWEGLEATIALLGLA